MNLEPIIAAAVSQEASDVHLSPGKPVFFRVNGRMIPQGNTPVTKEQTAAWVGTLSDKIQTELKEERQSDFSLTSQAGIRMRVNVFYQRLGIAVAFRIIRSDIMSFEKLGLPTFIRDKIRTLDHGLVLVVGPTGQGKSTTLAALVNDKLHTEATNIITLEDPIEYVYPNTPNSIISQREVGRDVLSFHDGIKSALREDPDILLVGEMRDYKTISAAITMAETGHILLSTLHANTGAETVSRIIDSFPSDQQNQIRSQLAMNLKMVISQRLVPSIDGKSRVLAYEVMTNNYAIATKIRQNKINEIAQVFELSAASGEMISYERSLVYLYRSGKISRTTAVEHAIDRDRMLSMLDRT